MFESMPPLLNTTFFNPFTGCVKRKRLLMRCVIFLTLKLLQLVLVLIKIKIAIFLTSWSENAHFT